ncbi:hypothetical protein ACVWVZ_001940 [Pseudomonas tolaasii]
MKDWLDEIKWDSDGLVPAICPGLQDRARADDGLDEP